MLIAGLLNRIYSTIDDMYIKNYKPLYLRNGQKDKFDSEFILQGIEGTKIYIKRVIKLKQKKPKY